MSLRRPTFITLCLCASPSNTRTKWIVTNGEASLDYIDVSDLEGEGNVLAVRVRFWNGNLMHSKVRI